jgi:hypothetical protein
MDQPTLALRASLVLESRRSARRSAELQAQLNDPELSPWLDEVGRRYPRITADHERVRLAQILRGWAGRPGVRISEILACA